MIVMMWNIKFSSVFVLWHRILHCCWAELEITKFDPYLYHSLKIGLTYDQYTHRRISTVHPSWRDNWINRNSNVQIRKKNKPKKAWDVREPFNNNNNNKKMVKFRGKR